MYDINNILLPDDYIGNSLSNINKNFEKLEEWTNNIILSSEKLYQPLVNFYDFYGDFWKSSINFSINIKAIERLTDFNTIVTTNSARFIKPINIIYPDIFQYDNIFFENHKNIVVEWFKKNYPVTNPTNSEVFFVENSVAYVHIMFYNETIKANKTLSDNNRTILEKETICSTNNVSSTISCQVTYQGEGGRKVSCVNYEPQIMSDVCSGNTANCVNTITVTCSFENGGSWVKRTGRLSVDEYFKDRSENDKIFSLKMKVKNCEWVFERIVPYWGI